MNPRIALTVAMLLVGIVFNLVAEILLKEEEEIAELQKQLHEQRLTLQEIVVKQSPPPPVEEEIKE
jgi:uncharacterized membrane protein (DUF106 family)